jgi:hypothetical protein
MNEPFKDMSNEHMRFQKSFAIKNDIEKAAERRNEGKDKAGLKKTSKMNMKKFPK